MLETLLRRLRAPAPSPDPLAADEARLALAALLVRLARADHDYAASEKAQIDTLLARRYGLNPPGARALRHGAEQVEEEVGDTVHLTRLIKAAIPYEARFDLVVDLWSLALADGVRDHAENQFLRLVVRLVGVSDMESARARQQATAQI